MARIELTNGRTLTPSDSGTTENIVVPLKTLVLVFVSNAATANTLASEPDITGLGIVWSKVASVTTGAASDRRLTCFWGMTVSTGATGQITLNFPGQNQDFVAWSVFAYDDIDPSNAVAQFEIATTSLPSTSISVQLGLFVNATNYLVVGAVMISQPFSVNPGAGFTKIDEVPINRPGKDGILATEDVRARNATVDWSWAGIANAAAIALELTVFEGESPEILSRRFEPILFFHKDETFFPSDAKRYLEQSALWRAENPVDQKDSWGGKGSPFPRQPLIQHGSIAALPGEPGTFLGSSPNLIHVDGEVRFLELDGWRDKTNSPQPGVTQTSQNPYANREFVAKAYDINPELRDSKFWYHSEFYTTERLDRLLPSGHDGLALVGLIHDKTRFKNPALFCYYLFFPAHDEPLGAGCNNIEAREFAGFGGEWACIAVLLDRESKIDFFEPKFIGLTSRSPSTLLAGGANPPFSFLEEPRCVMQVAQWEKTQRSGDHPKIFVGKGTHGLYIDSGNAGFHDVRLSGESYNCGRLEESPPLTEGLGSTIFAPFLKFVGGLIFGLPGAFAGLIWGLVEWADVPEPTNVNLDEPLPDEVATPGNFGKVVHPADVSITETGAEPIPWKTRQDLEIGGRRYDFLVDRERHVWWPSDDKTSGFRGRWGPIVESDPNGLRRGMVFPSFHLMFFESLAKAFATPGFFGP
jgi:hypothetical protein